jgi:hypothetical protein
MPATKSSDYQGFLRAVLFDRKMFPGRFRTLGRVVHDEGHWNERGISCPRMVIEVGLSSCFRWLAKSTWLRAHARKLRIQVSRGTCWHGARTPSPLRSGGEGRGEEVLFRDNGRLRSPSPQPSPRASLRGEGEETGGSVKMRPANCRVEVRSSCGVMAGVCHALSGFWVGRLPGQSLVQR